MEDTKPKPFVFVLMPFNTDFADIYEVGIKIACRDAGAYCERVDEQVFVDNILERVYNQIAKADIIVAEMTGRNANVFYETGYAHALNKQVILLTQNSEDIPFDLTHYPHIVYSGRLSYLKSQLENRIRWCIENPKDSLSNVDLNLNFFINNTPLINNPTVTGSFRQVDQQKYEFWVTVDIHNRTNTVVKPESFSLALVTSQMIHYGPIRGPIASRATLPDSSSIYVLHQGHILFPEGWDSLPITFYIPTRIPKEDFEGQPVSMVLRLFTEVGPKDYPFTIALTELKQT